MMADLLLCGEPEAEIPAGRRRPEIALTLPASKNGCVLILREFVGYLVQ